MPLVRFVQVAAAPRSALLVTQTCPNPLLTPPAVPAYTTFETPFATGPPAAMARTFSEPLGHGTTDPSNVGLIASHPADVVELLGPRHMRQVPTSICEVAPGSRMKLA